MSGAAEPAQTAEPAQAGRGRTLRIDGLRWSRHQLPMRFSVGD